MEMPPKKLLLKMASLISQEEYAEMAIPSYLHRNPAMRWMACMRLVVLAKWLRRHGGPDARVMDFGCGAGVLFPTAARHAGTVYGIDPVLGPAEMVVDHYGFKNIRLMLPDEAQIQIPENSLDIIVCGEVLEHVENLSAVLSGLKSKMKPDGRMLVTIPTENALYRLGRRLAGFKGDYHVHEAVSIHRQILTAGFETVNLKHLPLYGPFAIYWAINYVLANRN